MRQRHEETTAKKFQKAERSDEKLDLCTVDIDPDVMMAETKQKSDALLNQKNNDSHVYNSMFV